MSKKLFFLVGCLISASASVDAQDLTFTGNYTPGTWYKLGERADVPQRDPAAYGIGGWTASVKDSPGYVQIKSYTYITENNGAISGIGFGHCGAVRIHEHFLATAGHCLEPGLILEAMLINFGADDISHLSAGIAIARNAYRHPDYDPNGLKNDIALIDISGSGFEDLKKHIEVAEIGEIFGTDYPNILKGGGHGVSPKQFEQEASNQVAVLEGRINDIRPVLIPFKEGPLIVKNVDPAKITLEALPEGATGRYRPCQGDSGSPIYILDSETVEDNGRLRGYPVSVVGVLSSIMREFGSPASCSDFVPVQYTVLKSYRKWIYSTINDVLSRKN